jgi:alpha-1,2-mannosyltransferase
VALRKIELENGGEVMPARLPVVFYGHKVLSWLPYKTARSIWLACCIAALVLFAVLWPGAHRAPMMLAIAWSLPATTALLYGQDIPFWLMFFAGGLVLLEKKRPWLAGVVFSLCICKYHLALGIPILLAAQKRWNTMISGGIAVLVWIASCFLIEGRDWPLQFAKISQMQSFSPAARMPNLYGLASWLPWPEGIEIIGAIAILGLLWWVCRRRADLGMAGAAAVACGLIAGHHAFAADFTLLIPLAVLVLQEERLPSWMRAWTLLMLSPVPLLIIISQTPMPAQALVVSFVVTAITLAGVAAPSHSLQRSLPTFTDV